MSESDESGRIAERLTAIRERLAHMRAESSESFDRLITSREAGERKRAERAVPPTEQQPPPAPPPA